MVTDATNHLTKNEVLDILNKVFNDENIEVSLFTRRYANSDDSLLVYGSRCRERAIRTMRDNLETAINEYK